MYREIPEKKNNWAWALKILNRWSTIDCYKSNNSSIPFLFNHVLEIDIFTKFRVRPNSFSARVSTSILVARDTPGNRARCTGCPDTGGNDTLFFYEASSPGRLSCSNNDYNAVPALDATLDNGRHVDHPYSLAFPCSLSATRFNLNKINS